MRRRLFSILAAAVAASVFVGTAGLADIGLNTLFTDNAVFQRNVRVPVWGTGEDGEQVTVGIAGQTASATVKDGRWTAWLKPMKAGGPYTLRVQGRNTIEVKNILIGEVWVCSGQSNMQWTLANSTGGAEAIAASADPQLRLFTVPRQATPQPIDDVSSSWKVAGPDTTGEFSGVGYFFGRELRTALKVPVGLINTSYGGTPAEAWTNRAALARVPDLKYLVDNYAKQVSDYQKAITAYDQEMATLPQQIETAKAEGRQPPAEPKKPADPARNSHSAGGLYNAMIAPIIPYSIKGAIWYQGESNAGRAYEYRTLFPAMIRNWRSEWRLGDFPFLFAQLAPFGTRPGRPDSTWPELREAQLLTTINTPKTAMAVITDYGNCADIHPKDKLPVGERLSLAAKAIAYGQKVSYTGPLYRSMKVNGIEAVLSFDKAGGGLAAKGGALRGFQVAGSDRQFVDAVARIEGKTVVVSSPQVARPVAVRYGWSDCPDVNLFDKAGLPASPFRTDDFPMVTKP